MHHPALRFVERVAAVVLPFFYEDHRVATVRQLATHHAASGDLTKRKLLPALFHLEQAGLLPDFSSS